MLTYSIEITMGLSGKVYGILQRVDRLATKLVFNTGNIQYSEALNRMGLPQLRQLAAPRALVLLHSYVHGHCSPPSSSFEAVGEGLSLRLGNRAQSRILKRRGTRLARCENTSLGRACRMWNRLSDHIVREILSKAPV